MERLWIAVASWKLKFLRNSSRDIIGREMYFDYCLAKMKGVGNYTQKMLDPSDNQTFGNAIVVTLD